MNVFIEVKIFTSHFVRGDEDGQPPLPRHGLCVHFEPDEPDDRDSLPTPFTV